MKKAWRVFMRMTRAYLFYPLMIGIFLWLYIKDAHWIFGVMVIAAILILDPIWGAMAKNAMRMWRKK